MTDLLKSKKSTNRQNINKQKTKPTNKNETTKIRITKQHKTMKLIIKVKHFKAKKGRKNLKIKEIQIKTAKLEFSIIK